MAAAKKQRVSAQLIEAFERAWAAIQKHHPEVPDVLFITGSGADGRRNSLRLGHYATGAWSASKGKGKLPELFVGGEGFKRGARDVLGTLIHEAAHGLADARKIQDTSRQGRYHNKKFKALGEEMGLVITKTGNIGWSGTEVPDATAKKYAKVIRDLDKAMTFYRSGQARGRRKPKKTQPPATCGCDRKIRVAPSTLEKAPITCGACGENFALPEAA